MTALTTERMRQFERWTYRQLILKSGTKAWKHGICLLDPAVGKVQPGVLGTGLLFIGLFAESVDATAADKLVNVNFGTEKEIEWLANATVGPVLATDIGKLCYVADDQTVTITATGASVAGRVWAVDAIQGVGIERVAVAPPPPVLAADEEALGEGILGRRVPDKDPGRLPEKDQGRLPDKDAPGRLPDKEPPRTPDREPGRKGV